MAPSVILLREMDKKFTFCRIRGMIVCIMYRRVLTFKKPFEDQFPGIWCQVTFSSRGLMHVYSCAQVEVTRWLNLLPVGSCRLARLSFWSWQHRWRMIVSNCSRIGNHDSGSSFLASCLGSSRYQKSIREFQSWQRISNVLISSHWDSNKT